MEAKYTPGPWTIAHARNGTGDIGIKAPGVPNIIAECYAAMRRHDERSSETLANARLMAAAPKLLAALSMFVSYGCPVCNGDCAAANPPVLDCPMKLANAAIQCATED